MDRIAVTIEQEVADTIYSYQILSTGEDYKIWLGTKTLSGRYIGGEFAYFEDALMWLAKFIRDGEGT